MRFVARRLESIPCPGECKGNWATVAIWLTATRTGAFGRSTTRGRSKVVLAHHKCPPSRPYPTDMRANGRDRVESIPMPCPLGCNPRAPCPIADSGRDPRHPSSMETPENPVGNPPLFPPPPFREFMLSNRKRRPMFASAKPSPSRHRSTVSFIWTLRVFCEGADLLGIRRLALEIRCSRSRHLNCHPWQLALRRAGSSLSFMGRTSTCFSLQLLVPKPRSSINRAASRIRGIWVSLRRCGFGFRGASPGMRVFN